MMIEESQGMKHFIFHLLIRHFDSLAAPCPSL